ncbi:gibberellin 20 oxidase 2-like [Neltuma alba]|uniref:gibberellin 20 oxidase 2-like n=1 Tax=Neltuma alba TaxID=207710 RepID=UPI0010A2D6A3|nr:gibberellin 20 oxidase 2-like [Prosopis alba]
MASSVLLSEQKHEERKDGELVFPCELGNEVELPKNCVWSKEYLVQAQGQLEAPIVDLGGVLRGEQEAIDRAVEQIRDACLVHGFFIVINHGVDDDLIKKAYERTDAYFKQPIDTKLKAYKPKGSLSGYSGAHSERFSSNLTWKETLTFLLPHDNPQPAVRDYFVSTLGQDFYETGDVFQKYCEAMKELGMKMMDLLSISLGLDQMYLRDFFSDGCSLMRCNYYPFCQVPAEVLGTGPHRDPTSLTILHQDHVGGLEVFSGDKWFTIEPLPNSFVINIGDTFMALTNGRYKSSRHRAVVNNQCDRRSLAFFINPKGDKVVQPPSDILSLDGTRNYPDFTWSELAHFTQWHYRADEFTFPNFLKFRSAKPQAVST